MALFLEALLLLEFFLILTGYSVMFRASNAIQVILHGLGVMACTWMILDAWSYQVIYPITFTFGIVPFVQELVIVCKTSDKFRIMTVVQAEAKIISD